jgi:Trk-type K+ transport system membrane component
MSNALRCWKYWVPALVIGAAAFFLFMLWKEGEDSLLGQAEAWITRHDLTIDLVTVWTLAVGFAALALVELVTWLTMVGARDETTLGKRLRPKKLGSAFICTGMSTLYSLTLYAYYREHQFDVWSVFALRILIIAGIVTAVTFGVRFVTALRREVWGWDGRETEQNTREVEQNEREVFQNNRDELGKEVP